MSRLRLTLLLASAFIAGSLTGWRGLHAGAAETVAAPAEIPVQTASAPTPAVGSEPAAAATPDQSYQYMLLFARVMQLVRQDYVDPKKVEYKQLTYAALRGMLSSLDPHSQFLDEDAYADLTRETSGGPFSGLGIIVGEKNGSTVIVSPMEDSPAGKAGLLPGDRILRIGGRSTEHLSLDAVGDMLKGKIGEKSNLTIMRPDAPGSPEGKVFEVPLTRTIIELHSVKDAHLLPENIAGKEKVGYLRIEEFGANTPDEFNKAVDDLEAQGLDALVIDLRNNGGGLVDAAVAVAGEFVPPNSTIVSLKGRTPANDQIFVAKGDRQRGDYPVALLINGYSASAAEILSGSMKDLKRAVLVGEQTFGKGSVQTVQSLGGGIGLRITTAKYFTPSNRVIHEVGITPDIVVPITNAEERRVILSEAKRALTAEEKTEAAKADDRQLARAVVALRTQRAFKKKQEQGTVPTPTPTAPAAAH